HDRSDREQAGPGRRFHATQYFAFLRRAWQDRGQVNMATSVRDAKRVVLCDDHEIVREAIKARMADSHVLDIVGEAGDGRDVVDVVKELEPDVLIIDVELPKRDGIEAT